MTTRTRHIVVLGGGYGGVMTALRLAGRTKRLDVRITLVNAVDHFVERPRLHEKATGSHLRQRALTQMLRGTRVWLTIEWVTAIDARQQSVYLDTAVVGEQRLTYDYLINALGSRVDRDAIPGVAEHAYALDPYGDLTTSALAEKLVAYGEKRFRVVVVGGGATGVETAAQIKGSYPDSDVSIVTRGDVGAFKGARVQKHIAAAMREQSISLREHCRVVKVEPRGVVLDSGRIPADIVIWAGGFRASSLARQAGVQVNAHDQILVDPSCVPCPTRISSP